MFILAGDYSVFQGFFFRVPGAEHASRLKVPELSGETKAHANLSVFQQAQLGSVSLTFLNHSNSIILKSFSMLSQLARIFVITNHVSYNQKYSFVPFVPNKTFKYLFPVCTLVL